mgnify:CR=1 FL=1
MVNTYKPLFPPYVMDGMSYKDKIYGMPYYADTFVFIYDETKLKKAGFENPPATWEELAEQAKAVKEQGICEYPIVLNFNQNEVKMTEIFYAMTYSRGQNVFFFGEDGSALFNQADHSAGQALQWLIDGLKAGVIDPNSLNLEEIPAIKSIQSDAHAFAIMEKYTVAEINGPKSAVAGRWKIGLMPGPSHETIGGVRFYSMTSNVVKRGPEAVAAAGKFLEFFGGKTNGEYVVTKRWAVENGLGFGVTDLYQDKDVIEAFGKWGDVNVMLEQDRVARAKDGQKNPWFGPWAQFMRTQVNQAMASKGDVKQALDAMAQQWETLKAQYS